MNDKLKLNALGHLDGALLEECLSYRARLCERPPRRAGKRAWLGAVACIIAFCCVFPVFLFAFGQIGSAKDEPPSELSLYALGEVAENTHGTFFCDGSGKNSLKFIMNKTDTYEHHLMLTGYSQEGAATYIGTTDERYETGNAVKMEEAFVITVNGNICTDLPSAPGMYEITVDYSPMAEICRFREYTCMQVTGFGYFYLQPYLLGMLPGETLRERNGTVEYLSTEGNCVTFTLEKTGETPVWLFMVDNTVKNIGYASNVGQYYCGANDPAYEVPSRYILIEDAFTVTVNGERTEGISAQPGSYVISVDFTSLANACGGIGKYTMLYLKGLNISLYVNDWRESRSK